MTPLAQQKVDPRFETTRGEAPPQLRSPPQPKRPPMIGPPPMRQPPKPPPGPPPGRTLPPTSDRVLRSYSNPRLNQDDTLKRVEEKEDEEQDWDEEVSSGKGIKNHILPSTVPFGKIALDLNKLFYQNILSIKRHNGNKIIGHKNKRVSDNFVDIIMKMYSYILIHLI
jgi:hypothetical protein